MRARRQDARHADSLSDTLLKGFVGGLACGRRVTHAWASADITPSQCMSHPCPWESYRASATCVARFLHNKESGTPSQMPAAPCLPEHLSLETLRHANRAALHHSETQPFATPTPTATESARCQRSVSRTAPCGACSTTSCPCS